MRAGAETNPITEWMFAGIFRIVSMNRQHLVRLLILVTPVVDAETLNRLFLDKGIVATLLYLLPSIFIARVLFYHHTVI